MSKEATVFLPFGITSRLPEELREIMGNHSVSINVGMLTSETFSLELTHDRVQAAKGGTFGYSESYNAGVGFLFRMKYERAFQIKSMNARGLNVKFFYRYPQE